MQNAVLLPSQTEHDRFIEKIAALKETVVELRARTSELKEEREQLLEENRALRHEITQLRLLQELEDSIDAIEDETGQLPAAPPSAEHLYTLLPPSFSFPVFFRIAESQGLETDEARRCLLHFLAKDLIAQEGSRLVKTQKAVGGGTNASPDGA
jgi:regulator of replication initiation timing